MMIELHKGNTALLSYQQAIGGSISRSEITKGGLDEESEPLVCSSSNVFIVVPTLEEIRVPPAPVPFVTSPAPAPASASLLLYYYYYYCINQLVFLPDNVANIIRHLIYLRKKMFTSAQQRDPGDYIRLGF